MEEAQQNYLKLLKQTFEKRQEFIRYDVPLFQDFHNKLTVYSSAISRNCELLVCGCSKSIVILYDLIAKKSYKAQNTSKLSIPKHQLITVAFSNCYDYVISANTLGDLLIYKISIETQINQFHIDLIKFVPKHHIKAIQMIFHSNIDQLLTISSDQIIITNFYDLITNDQIQKRNLLQINGITASRLSFFNDNYYLYLSLKDGSITQVKSQSFYQTPKIEQKIYQLPDKNHLINHIAVTKDQSILAIAYSSNQNDTANLILYYKKRNKQIFQQIEICKSKISQLLFFNDNSHLMIASYDGTFQLLNISKKKLLGPHKHQMNQLGVIGIFPLNEYNNFPNFISVGQDHFIKKYYFGNVKDQLFEYIPFIFWVEQRISQELHFQSELHNYQKMLYIESMGVDSVRMKELNQSIFGYDFFNPLLKRIIDYTEYSEQNKALFQQYDQTKSNIVNQSQIKPRKLSPLREKKIDLDSEQKEQEIIQKEQIQNESSIFDNHYKFLFMRMINTVRIDKIKMMILQKCPFIFDEKLPFKQLMFDQFKQMKNLKYLDLSFNSLSLDDVLEILNNLRGVTILDFLNLAHNNIGDGVNLKITQEAIMKLLDEVEAISLRSNKLSDLDGEAILNQIKFFKKLTILDISGNLNFFSNTLQQLKSITILKNDVQFSAQRNDNLVFLEKIKRQEEEENQEDKHDYQSKDDKQSNFGDGQNLIQNLPDSQSQTLDRQSSTSSQPNYMSLQLLCIQFEKEFCEQAMKTATDFLVHRQVTNLYIYVVDNKKDDVWETSISIFYTRDLKKKQDYVYGFISGFFIAIINFIKNIYKVIKTDFSYCFKSIFFSTLFIRKYLICGLCTFLTTTIGRFIVKIFGVESSYYEYNPKVKELEEALKKQSTYAFILFAIYFISYYFVVIFLPIIFVNACEGQQWTGHLIYLAFAAYSFIVEGYLGLSISNLKVTTNEYTDGSTIARYFYIIKDLLISQLTKFELYTCVCFIVLINSCAYQTVIAWIGVGIISLNLLFDIALIIRYLLVPYLYKQQLTYIDVYTQFSTLYQMNIVVNLLEKWSEQNTIYVFFLKIEVPQKVLVSIIKAFFQDIPLLLLQAIYFGSNVNNVQTNILVVSLIIVVVHCIFSIIKMLSITKASKITENIMLQEIKKFKKEEITTSYSKELQIYLKKFKRKLISFLTNNQEYNQNAVLALIDSERANLMRPHTLADDKYIKQKSSKIIPVRKGITMMGNKIQRINVSKNKKANIQELYKKVSVKAALNVFGNKVKSWQLGSDIQIDIVDTLLSDVPRQLFVTDLEWEIPQPWISNIKISSLSQEIQGFKLAFDCFKNKNELIILDFGSGSGYVSTILIALALRRNPKMKIQITLIDHVEDALKNFLKKIDSEFKQFTQNVQIITQVQNCLEGFQFLQNQQFDFIHGGFSLTKWRIVEQIIPLLKFDGVFYGYETLSSIEQKSFTWINLEKQQQNGSKLETYGIMEPLLIQYPLIEKNSGYDIKKYIILYDKCAICRQSLTKQDKQFINHYWGECICFKCGNDNLEQQGEEIDIAKLNYKSNVIYYNGENCKLNQIKCKKYLYENLTYRFGQKYGTIREYTTKCPSCNNQRGFGFSYRCLICDIVYCNTCGMKYMSEQKMNFHITCNQDHPLLRIMFPEKNNKKK